ncbi:hypothetical protein MCOR27_010186 [Pyricularia oryzae]|uniref:Extracellular membrane protein CFEM domain-containing protein n=5 Tax=Pyricularia TaxID=48558 RepID=A0ABQ8NTR4_PYRGI|nr:uncharacterized protein MGG_08824 [Pyricularia oryzae 70-15]ELQ42172.1 hypothetical protein OOU_Y34scaffold00228g63 [Pyricularia oryzae Y34]KAH8837241.1 hypothetical protein MCOR01_010877 [Pyricularia oryzae]KAI6301977.1 hypothetical protein MCOR33_002599 [Pyricularia grisea]EHA54033.1 hypothetical protein MGG_08824 [Pyricularia oryzae 70-15]KAH9438093.1 hypothetical protein MCOR02_001734 [Pyricularia oryzae]
MVRTSTYAIALLGSVVAMTAAQRTQEELDKYNEVATCVNKCFFKSFVPGSCTNDAACHCNQEKMRNEMYCCEAKECANINEIATQQVIEHIERIWQSCEPLEHNRPFDKPAVSDVEKMCGVTLKVSSSSSSSSASSTAAPTGSPTGTSSSSSTLAVQTTGTSTPTGAATTSASSPASTGAASAVRGTFILPGLAAFVAGSGLALW